MNPLVLWTTRQEKDERGRWLRYSAFRHQLVFNWRALSWFPQYRPNQKSNWFNDLPDWSICYGRWHWGSAHGWYDGPHCMQDFGFVHVYWRNYSCKKCARGAKG